MTSSAHQFVFGPWQEAWLKTLESGMFKQVRGNLCKVHLFKNGNVKHYEFCCLGIFNEVLIENGIKLSVEQEKIDWHGAHKEIINYEHESMCLPSTSKEIGKFYSSMGHWDISKLSDEEKKEFWEDNKKCMSLANMNDQGISFKEIAKFVRKWPRQVFSESA